MATARGFLVFNVLKQMNQSKVKLDHEEHEGHKEKMKESPYDFFVGFVPLVVNMIFNQKNTYLHQASINKTTYCDNKEETC